MTRADEPFRFFSRLSLTLATGRKARTLQELADGVAEAPESVIYQHTHGFLKEYQYLAPEPPNDFAYWVEEVAGDRLLGERLSAVDTVRCGSLKELKEALLAVLREHLARGGGGRPAPEGEEFYFLSAKRFSVTTPYAAHDLAEFAEALKRVSISSLYLHVFESRLRLPPGTNDFSLWLDGTLGEKELARAVAAPDPYAQTLEDLRRWLLDLVEERLHAPA